MPLISVQKFYFKRAINPIAKDNIGILNSRFPLSKLELMTRERSVNLDVRSMHCNFDNCTKKRKSRFDSMQWLVVD